MREIKFRAYLSVGEWDEDGEKQAYQMVYDLAYENYEPINDLLMSTENLMQYTGLHDKNGKEIYEGDIVLTIANGGYWKKKPYIVEYNRHGFNLPESENVSWGMGESPTYSKFEYEVAGNIYENPELMPEEVNALSS